MPPKARTITDAELEIMKLLWSRGTLTAKEIREELYPAGTASDNATVQKLLQRLESKEIVVRNRDEFVHRFQAKVDRLDIFGEELQSLADAMIEGSWVPALTHILKRQKLTPAERRQLREMLEEHR